MEVKRSVMKREQKIRALLATIGRRLNTEIEIVKIYRRSGAMNVEFQLRGQLGSSAAYNFPFLNNLEDDVSASAFEDLVVKSHNLTSTAPPIAVNTIAKGMTATASGSR